MELDHLQTPDCSSRKVSWFDTNLLALIFLIPKRQAAWFAENNSKNDSQALTSSRGLKGGQEDPFPATEQVVRPCARNNPAIEFKPVQECCAWQVATLE